MDPAINYAFLMAQKMNSRMKEYDHWSGWSDMDLDILSSRILKNLSGILQVRCHEDGPFKEEYDASVLKYIQDQAADIANFAMMIAVNFGELGEKQMTEQNEEKMNPINEKEMHTKTAEELREAQMKEDIEEEQKVLISSLAESLKNISPEIIRNLKIVLNAGLEDAPLPSRMEPSQPSDEVEVPYENTWVRLDNIEALVHDITARLEPVLADSGTVATEINEEAITQVDSKLGSIASELRNLLHRIQL